LNQDTDIHITKSGTDFECFTNQVVLFGVEKDDYLEYKEKMEAILNGPNLSPIQKHFPIELNYSEKLKRMFISERVYITDWFDRD
jgi:hypothetical protein